MDELGTITHKLESLFLLKLADAIEISGLNPDDAKKYAQEFLQIEPFTSFDDAKLKIAAFSEKNTLFGNLKKYLDGYYEEMRKNELIEQMRVHMRAGNIDQALQVVQK